MLELRILVIPSRPHPQWLPTGLIDGTAGGGLLLQVSQANRPHTNRLRSLRRLFKRSRLEAIAIRLEAMATRPGLVTACRGLTVL